MRTAAYSNRMRKLRGAEKGKRAFILGNGPSIRELDLAPLKSELVIGMNASTLLEREHGFHTHYYTVSDTRFLSHPDKRGWATDALAPDTVRVLRAELAAHDAPGLPNPTYYVPAIGRNGFSHNLALGFYFGCSTTMLAIQLAHYLGCSELCLLGVDLRYTPDAPRFYREDAPQMEDAFTSTQIWNIANAARELAATDVKLVQCSPRSLLRPHVPYVPFSNLVGA